MLLREQLRAHAGRAGCAGGRIEHYLLAVIYASGLAAGIQLVLAGVVVATNGTIHAWVLLRWRRRGLTVRGR